MSSVGSVRGDGVATPNVTLAVRPSIGYRPCLAHHLIMDDFAGDVSTQWQIWMADCGGCRLELSREGR
jgi:hypothetical protein